MDDKRHEEFARAKQFKKLNKLLSTPEAKRPITQFRTFAVYVLAIVIILQVICFVVDRVLMNKISRLISTGSQTVTALTSVVQIQYVTTVLWSTFDAYAPPGWNTYSVAVREYIGSLYTPLLALYVSPLSKPSCNFFLLRCAISNTNFLLSTHVQVAHFNSILTEAFLHPVSSVFQISLCLAR